MRTRTLAIGDIHGCLINLDALLSAVAPTPEDHLAFLGDFVDRGPDSKGVLNRIIQLARTHRITAIQGNHEQMMLAAQGRMEYLRDWILNGGDATLASYAGNRATLRDVPREHWHFLQNNLVNYLETDTHIFVHANVGPDQPMSDQPNYMLRWERCDNVVPHESGKIIICGHTPQTSGRPLNRGFAICIDTYACGGGFLTCIETASGRLWQANAKGSATCAHISDFEEL